MSAAALPLDGRSSPLRQSYRAGLVLLGYVILVKVVLTVAAAASPGFRSPSQTAVFAWWFIAALAAAGALTIWLNHWVGLPGVWDPAIPLKDRLTVPVLIGLAGGAVGCAIDAVTGWTAASAAQHGVASIHIPFPNSLLIYPGGAIIVNVLYYLIPITILLALLKLAMPGRFAAGPPAAFFWPIGVLAALLEPVSQFSPAAGGTTPSVVLFSQDLLFNLLQVWTYRRAGFAASVVLRTGYYLVWHVLWGALGH